MISLSIGFVPVLLTYVMSCFFPTILYLLFPLCETALPASLPV